MSCGTRAPTVDLSQVSWRMLLFVMTTALATAQRSTSTDVLPPTPPNASEARTYYPAGTCGVTGEYDQAQYVSCASVGPDSRISGVSLADFGTPVGSCATGFTPGKCHEDVSAQILSLCKGKQSCGVTCLGTVNPGTHPLTPSEHVATNSKTPVVACAKLQQCVGGAGQICSHRHAASGPRLRHRRRFLVATHALAP